MGYLGLLNKVIQIFPPRSQT